MKKTLLTLLVAMASIFGIQASTMEYGYSGDVITGLGTNNKCVFSLAMELPSSVTTAMKGSKITAISVGFGKGLNKEMTVCVWDDLAKGIKPLASGKTNALKESQYNEIKLDEPFVLDGRTLYVGYIYECTNAKDVPIGTDMDVEGYVPEGDWACISTTLEDVWFECRGFGEEYGNHCIRCTIEGDDVPASMAMPHAIGMPGIIRPWTDFDFNISFRNLGEEEVKSVEMAYVLGNGTKKTSTYNFETPVAVNAIGTAKFTESYNEEGVDFPAKAWVTKVNGVANPAASVELKTVFSPNSKLFERRMVLEEYTGVGCQFCPRGYYGIEQFKKELAAQGREDSFIAIGVHNYGTDPMVCTAYSTWANNFISGAPQGTVNRMSTFTYFDPSLESIRSAFATVNTLTKEYIEVSAEYEDETQANVVATTKMVFAEDMEKANYGLAYVLIQNDLGPYNQVNGFTGGRLGEMGGFENLGASVPLMYNDVARDLYNWNGDKSACPTTIVEGEEYTHSKTMSLKRCTTLKNASLDNVEVVVLIINRTTGEIVNAAKAKIGETSINKVEETAVAPAYVVRALDGRIAVDGEYDNVTVYTAAGAVAGRYAAGEVINVASGLYLVSVDGEKAVKVMVK